MKLSKPAPELTQYELHDETEVVLGHLVVDGIEVMVRATQDGITIRAYKKPYESPDTGIGIPLKKIVGGIRECREKWRDDEPTEASV
jgi:hypothetical protein